MSIPVALKRLTREQDRRGNTERGSRPKIDSHCEFLIMQYKPFKKRKNLGMQQIFRNILINLGVVRMILRKHKSKTKWNLAESNI